MVTKEMDNFCYRKVQKVSNNESFCLVLPKEMCRDLDIKKGDYVKVVLQGKNIVVTKV